MLIGLVVWGLAQLAPSPARDPERASPAASTTTAIAEAAAPNGFLFLNDATRSPPAMPRPHAVIAAKFPR